MNKEEKTEAFNWAKEFPKLCDEEGNFEGFDVVIGNPPYMDSRNIPAQLKEHYNIHYPCQKNNFDLYSLFIEKGLQIVKDKGYIAYIVPKPLLYNSTFTAIRKQIFCKNVEEIKILDNFVFKEAKVENIILFIENTEQSNKDFTIKSKNTYHIPFSDELKQGKPVVVANDDEIQIIEKLKNETKLCEVAEIIRGMELGKKTLQRHKSKTDYTTEIFAGEAINKYWFDHTKLFYVNKDSLKKYEKKVHQRFTRYPRILLRRVANKPIATILSKGAGFINNLNTIYNISIKKEIELNEKYLTAIFNSKLATFFIQKVYSANEKLFPYIRIEQIKQLPVKIASKEKQQAIAEKVDVILQQKEKNPAANTGKLENDIDQMVYKLYDLTEDEIKHIERAVMKK